MKFRIKQGIVLLMSALALALMADESSFDAKTVHEAEEAKPFDPSQLVLRGDSEGGKVNFKVGEEMTFKFSISYGKGGKPEKPFKITWRRFGDDGKEFDKNYPATEITPEKPVIFKTRAHRPGFVTVRVHLLDSNGKIYKNKHGKKVLFTGALGAEIEKMKPLPEPKDFDAFWKAKLAELAKIPMKPELTPVKSSDPAVAVWQFSIPCLGGTPSTGLIYMPVNAKPKSLPAIAHYFGYGRPGSVAVYYKEAHNHIVISVSRFGIKQRQSKKYYDEQSKKLSGYGFKNNADRETSYFKGMVLRDYRALQYLKSRPEWNGRDLKVTGGSMGGLQSAWMGGLDPDIAEVSLAFPWCCDLGANLDKRPRSDWAPAYTPDLRYYDPVYFAKRFSKKTRLTMFTGLGDRVCPVTGVTLLYLAAPCKEKKIRYQQAATHAPAHPNPQNFILKGTPSAK